MQVMERMSTYANQSTPLKPQKRKAERLLEDRGESRRLAREDLTGHRRALHGYRLRRSGAGDE